MKLIDGLKTRRSIRKYKNKEVEDDKIKNILQLAIMAPSAHNSNPWYFLIVKDKIIKKELAIKMANKYKNDLKKDGYKTEQIQKIINKSIITFSTAPVLIVPCLDMKRMEKYSDEKRQIIEHQMGVQSVSAAIQNMLLAAHNECLGECWYCATLFAQEIVKKVLNIPEDIEPQAFITIGYTLTENIPSPPPRLKLNDICFLNKWGEKF